MNIKKTIAHFFIPGESNNYQARGLHLDFLSFYLVTAFVLVLIVKNGCLPSNNVLGFATDISIPKLLQLTNEKRQTYHLSALAYNDQLADAAYLKAQDMFARNYWSHYAPDGTTPWNFILRTNYQYEYAGENLAKNFLFSQGVVDAWMDSPTHRDNLLRKEYTEVGFAVVNGVLNGEETTLVVQMFGTPLRQTTAKIARIQPTIFLPPVQSQVAAVVAGRNNVNQPKVNLTFLSIDLMMTFAGLMVIVLLADLYVAEKMKIIRMSGKNLAHLVFIGFLVAGVLLFISQGKITHYAAFIKPN